MNPPWATLAALSCPLVMLILHIPITAYRQPLASYMVAVSDWDGFAYQGLKRVWCKVREPASIHFAQAQFSSFALATFRTRRELTAVHISRLSQENFFLRLVPPSRPHTSFSLSCAFACEHKERG